MGFRDGITARRLRNRLPKVAGRRGTASMVLGLVGLIGGIPSCCGGAVLPFAICSTLAWSLGQSELRMYRALGAVGAEESQARTGYVLGVIGTVLASIGMIGWIVYIMFIVGAVVIGSMGQSRILLFTEF